jgi:hypothetical protein
LRWDLGNILPWLALNHDPPDLCLLSSYDYRLELLHLASGISPILENMTIGQLTTFLSLVPEERERDVFLHPE